MVVPLPLLGCSWCWRWACTFLWGTRETLALRPTENRPTADVAVSTPSTRGELTRHWAQAMCVFQLVSVDLLLVTIAALLLAFTDVLPAKRDIGLFIAAYLGTWGVVWLVQLAAVKVERRTYYMLGHWMLFFLCAALMAWGAFSF